jgi:hypothetical protein
LENFFHGRKVFLKINQKISYLGKNLPLEKNFRWNKFTVLSSNFVPKFGKKLVEKYIIYTYKK